MGSGLESTKLNANGQRWVSELSEFNFSVKYRPGVINKDADCLSRLPLDINKYENLCQKEVSPDSFRALVAGVLVQEQCDETWLVNSCESQILVKKSLWKKSNRLRKKMR